ncbi:type II toxin-antitoxin system VapB family antitoxin [uncultured Sphingomonas sp.]|uniref:type II toxin-antitoxin system VapB family antitoxin n=1 Tax=uncultured Sphingomonas sp. TaxID=158754 RepID=UPI0035CB14E3
MVSDVGSSEATMLIGQIVVLTGRTEAEVIIGALRRELAFARAARRRPTAEQILDDAKRVRRHLKLPLINYGELLYDEHGLPR